MYPKSHRWIAATGLLASMVVAGDAFAGTAGSITYAPPSHAIPVLSDVMLMVLGLLLAVLAFRTLRIHGRGQPLSALVALAIMGASMLPGTKFVQEAYATVYGYIMDSATGGTVAGITTGVEFSIGNVSGVAQEVKTVSPPSGYTSAPTIGSPTCASGLIVQPGNACYVYFLAPPA